MNDEREHIFDDFDAPEPPLDLCNKILERVETTKQQERHAFFVKAATIGLFAGSLSFFAIVYLNTISDNEHSNRVASAAGPLTSSSVANPFNDSARVVVVSSNTSEYPPRDTNNRTVFFVKETK